MVHPYHAIPQHGSPPDTQQRPLRLAGIPWAGQAPPRPQGLPRFNQSNPLRPLAAAWWRIRHDLDDHPYGNIDHVVIGPPGVFVLDSKVWSGQISIEGGVPVVTPAEGRAGAWSLPRLPVQLRAMATGVKRRAGVPVWVQPVVVLWEPFPAGVVEADGVVYVHGSRYIPDRFFCEAGDNDVASPEGDGSSLAGG